MVTSGIDGIASVRYHYGAHWIAIRLGQWLNIGPFHFLHLTAQLFIPFCLQSMLNFAGENDGRGGRPGGAAHCSSLLSPR